MLAAIRHAHRHAPSDGIPSRRVQNRPICSSRTPFHAAPGSFGIHCPSTCKPLDEHFLFSSTVAACVGLPPAVPELPAPGAMPANQIQYSERYYDDVSTAPWCSYGLTWPVPSLARCVSSFLNPATPSSYRSTSSGTSPGRFAQPWTEAPAPGSAALRNLFAIPACVVCADITVCFLQARGSASGHRVAASQGQAPVGERVAGSGSAAVSRLGELAQARELSGLQQRQTCRGAGASACLARCRLWTRVLGASEPPATA